MSTKNSTEKTHFGFQQVSPQEKTSKVADVFHSVASQYDIMNDLMSFGLHRLWKRFTIGQSRLRPGDWVLDLAGGTGDLTRLFSKRVGPHGRVFLTDINSSMLKQGRDKLIDQNQFHNVTPVQVNAEHIPFADNSFHCVSIGFGLRNVTDKEQAIREMFRVLKPGGKLLILEFSKPTSTLAQKAYDAYSFNIIPKVGEWVTQDKDSYQYLVESIRMHPDQKTLLAMLKKAGFNKCGYHNMAAGVVALHYGYKV